MSDSGLAMSRCIAAFESEGCHVRRRGDALEVGLPGLEHWIFPGLGDSPHSGLLRWFWDRLDVRVLESGEIRYHLHYWSRPQLAIHFMLNAGLLLEALGNHRESGWSGFARAGLLANLLPAAVYYLYFMYVKVRIMGKLPS